MLIAQSLWPIIPQVVAAFLASKATNPVVPAFITSQNTQLAEFLVMYFKELMKPKVRTAGLGVQGLDGENLAPSILLLQELSEGQAPTTITELNLQTDHAHGLHDLLVIASHMVIRHIPSLFSEVIKPAGRKFRAIDDNLNRVNRNFFPSETDAELAVLIFTASNLSQLGRMRLITLHEISPIVESLNPRTTALATATEAFVKKHATFRVGIYGQKTRGQCK